LHPMLRYSKAILQVHKKIVAQCNLERAHELRKFPSRKLARNLRFTAQRNPE
jgi:hypothetical protein